MQCLLSHLLTRSAARHPDRDAVRIDGQGLTYAELDRLTHRVARALRDRGIERGDRVGIYVHKSFASVISVFGILKAGAVYVPLDPNAPARRLAYIARDCGLKALLTAPSQLAALTDLAAEGAPTRLALLISPSDPAAPSAPPDWDIVTWETLQSLDDAAVEEYPAIETDLAYILYTSGSTGAPKGVMISHRTIFTFLEWCQTTFAMTHEDRVTSQAPLHFDLSTFDLYATIQAGGTIILVGEHLAALPVKLVALLQDEQVTITYLVPSILSLMLNYGSMAKHDLSRLRCVLFAGEVFPMKYLRRLVQTLPHAAFYNLYGPTETNVCTYYRVAPDDVAPERGDVPVPIGRAIENVEVFALDDQGHRIVEPGIEGELWARGSCVAQGYWGDPEKTARSFVQSPLQSLYPDPAYRTGDIVTLAPDRRNWLYVGRRDHMVKCRGYRIELGEIETALYRHDQVKEAAVIAIPDDLLGNRLRAYAVLADGATLTGKELESFCAGHVPKYMVPERIEICSELPKTSTGKVDRTALIAFATQRPPAPGRP